MFHPLLEKRSHLLLYAGGWILVAGIHLLLLHYLTPLNWNLSLTDSLVHNSLLALAGLAAWYPVRFSTRADRKMIIVALNYLLISAFILSIWFLVSRSLLLEIHKENAVYEDVFHRSAPYRLLAGFLLYLLVILIYYLINYNADLRERIQREARLSDLVKQSELNMLRAQINPHFLFNSLNSISLLAIKDPPKARDMIVKLSEFLRYALRKDIRHLTSLQDELLNIDRYIEIEEIRFGDKLKYVQHIHSDCLDCSLPAMILQPLIENAIKHGVYESLAPVEIGISGKCNPQSLFLTIENNYDPEAVPRPGAGVGLKNIRERLRLLYEDPGLLHVSNENGKFTVQLNIPQS